MIRNSKAQWVGSLKDGAGSVSLGSGAYSGAYSFASRFESGTGTNPEELIAAAHAGCFSMFLSGALTKAGLTPTRISTEARVHLEKVGEGFGITKIDLVTRAEVPGIDQAAFLEHAEGAKKNCPVSKALSAVEMTLDATLV